MDRPRDRKPNYRRFRRLTRQSGVALFLTFQSAIDDLLDLLTKMKLERLIGNAGVVGDDFQSSEREAEVIVGRVLGRVIGGQADLIVFIIGQGGKKIVFRDLALIDAA